MKIVKILCGLQRAQHFLRNDFLRNDLIEKLCKEAENYIYCDDEKDYFYDNRHGFGIFRRVAACVLSILICRVVRLVTLGDMYALTALGSVVGHFIVGMVFQRIAVYGGIVGNEVLEYG